MPAAVAAAVAAAVIYEAAGETELIDISLSNGRYGRYRNNSGCYSGSCGRYATCIVSMALTNSKALCHPASATALAPGLVAPPFPTNRNTLGLTPLAVSVTDF